MRLDRRELHMQLVQLLKREVDTAEDLKSVTWINAELPRRKIKALAFWAEPTMSRMFVNKAVSEQADLLSRACGSTGSGAAYLYNTIVSLAQLGLKDEYLDTLGSLVASKILRYRASHVH